MTYYRQCTLVKPDPKSSAVSEQIAWIPEKHSVVGALLRIKDENGWLVSEVGSQRQSENYLQDHERDFVGHRKRTDV